MQPSDTSCFGFRYETQAYRALNQALGRCLRHVNDWGAIILLDERFLHQPNVQKLSRWLRSEVQKFDSFDAALSDLESFFGKMKARAGVAAQNDGPKRDECLVDV